MRWIVLFTLLLTACSDSTTDPPVDGGSTAATTSTATETDTGSGGAGGAGGTAGSGGAGGEAVPHPIGMDLPTFAMEDLNPSSATFGQKVDSSSLLGKPFALIFLDSRCPACADVADDIWQAYQDHASWWGAQPTFAIQRAKAHETAPETTTEIVDSNDLPYLLDVYDNEMWMLMSALNHDFFAFSAKGKLEVWLELYEWPDDKPKFMKHMIDRYGE